MWIWKRWKLYLPEEWDIEQDPNNIEKAENSDYYHWAPTTTMHRAWWDILRNFLDLENCDSINFDVLKIFESVNNIATNYKEKSWLKEN